MEGCFVTLKNIKIAYWVSIGVWLAMCLSTVLAAKVFHVNQNTINLMNVMIWVLLIPEWILMGVKRRKETKKFVEEMTRIIARESKNRC